ncbi:MAG TPA: hypothetical protein VIZ70_07910 [Propionibacteriaceae bacterium]
MNECCRAPVAVEKALGEAIRAAIAAGHSWTEIGQSLGLQARTSDGVREEFEASRRWMRSRFWGIAGQET